MLGLIETFTEAVASVASMVAMPLTTHISPSIPIAAVDSLYSQLQHGFLYKLIQQVLYDFSEYS